MTGLLDTHAFLWFVLDDARLSATAKAFIADPANPVLVSPASYWEIAIKVSIGKYALNRPFDDFMADHLARNSFGILPIRVEHAATVVSLPFHHRDPFDRMLIAQAKVDGIALVSNEVTFDAYGVNRIW